MAADPQVLHELARLMNESNWSALANRARELSVIYPEDATILAYIAHALRELGKLDEGYGLATRAVAADPKSSFAQNRVSLLANLTGHYAEAYAAGEAVLDFEVPNAEEMQNVANTIVNAIHAAAKLDRIADAIERFTPIIARLDYHELHFNSACLYALARDDRAFHYMRRALATGKKKSAFDDGDFAAIRDDPRFRELLARDWLAEQAALARAKEHSVPVAEFYDEEDTEHDALYARRAAARAAEALRDADAAARAELRPDHFLDPELLRVAPYAAVDLVREPSIESAIDSAIDDPAGYLVYADWLLERDNARGQLIVASQRCAEAVTEGERMVAFAAWAALVAANARRWLGTAVDLVAHRSRTRWFMGFITELVFDTGYELRPGDTEAELLTAALALPVMRFLRRLEIRDVFARAQLDYNTVIQVLCGVEVPHLRGLVIAPDQYQLSWTTLDASRLIERLPQLEELELGAGNLTLGRIDKLPNLRRLALRTTGLSRAVLAPILATTWAQLEELELWFGGEDGGVEVDHSDLWRILSGLAVPALRRLRLKNAEFTDALCVALVDAAILPRLTVLDLSMGTMTGAGAEVLIASAARLAHLERLDVSDNAIPLMVVARMRIQLPNVVVGTQKDGHYVTISE
jgi:uncharacterized protein (TIGR02996 family)